MSSGIPDNINTALIYARAQLRGTVQKEGFNRDQKYNYVGHEQVLMSGARDALLKFGLVLEQRSVQYVGELTAESYKGKRTIWHWTGTYALIHSSGQERTYQFAATTQPNDKAAFVASTSLDRTAYLRLLALAGTDEENPEANWHDDTREQSRRAEASAPRPQQQRAPERSNVVRLQQPKVEPAPEWQGWLEAYRGKMRQRRTAEELMTWWVELVITLPEGIDKGFIGAAWRMFRAYAEELGHPFARMTPEIDKRVRAAKAAKAGE